MKSAITLIAALLFSTAALAHDYSQGGLSIAHPYIPTPAASAKAAGGYLSITNSGTEPDQLIAVETAAARQAQLHTTETGSDGITKMVHLPVIDIPAGSTVALDRGAMHVMLMGLNAPLTEGLRVPAVLVFEKAGRVEIEFSVDAPVSGSEAHDHSGH